MSIDPSLVKTIPARQYYYDFIFYTKRESYSEYIARVWGWDESEEQKIFARDWEDLKPNIILFENEPVGSYCLTQTAGRYHLERFFILPEYQNKGIGTIVLQRILDAADQENLPVYLMYLNFNRAASLYTRMGFEITGRQEITGKQAYFVLAQRQPSLHASKRKYKAVIFDLFGTLVDNFHRNDYNSVMAEIADILKAPREDFLKLWKSSFNDRVTGIHGDQRESFAYICRELQIKVSPEQIERAFMIRLDFCRRTTLPRNGSVEVLTALRKYGYKVGLISDCTGEIPLVWDETPFTNLFDVKIFSCIVKTKKPDPRIYRMACEQLGVKPEECLYVGDGSSHELTGALTIGMHPIRIRDAKDLDEDQFMEREDDWTGTKISSLKEIMNYL